jgi:glutamate synthase (NADPH/NADH) small chain
MGYKVTIFEALMCREACLCTAFRNFVCQVGSPSRSGNLKKLGVDIQVNAVVGKFATVDELMGEYVMTLPLSGPAPACRILCG